VVEDKEILTHASLDEMHGSNLKKYSFYTAMLVKASLVQCRRVLTDYKLYSQMVPYIDKADYSAKSRILDIEGGIWRFKLHSQVLFEDQNEQTIHYTIIAGHFTGLTGSIYFESLGEKGTAIYLKGEQISQSWPPRFILERGAEIVFGYTATRMRSYI
jgi:hypothetical protein